MFESSFDVEGALAGARKQKEIPTICADYNEVLNTCYSTRKLVGQILVLIVITRVNWCAGKDFKILRIEYL